VVKTAIWAAVIAVALASAPVRAADTSRVPLKQVVLQLNWKHQFQFAGYYMSLQDALQRAEKWGGTIRAMRVRTAADAGHKAQAA
jgi:hypothetical protein